MSKRLVLSVVLTLLFWSSAYAGIKAGLEDFSAGALAAYRFSIAAIALAVYALVTRLRLPQRRDLPVLALAGFFGVTLYHLALNYGQRSVPAGVAGFLVATSPIFTALLASIFLKEHTRLLGWLGIFLGFVGVLVIGAARGASLQFDPNALLILLAALSTSVYFILQKPLLARYRPLELAAYVVWAGTLFLLPFLPAALTEIRAAGLQGNLVILYLGIFPGALAYFTWTYMIAHLPAATAVSYLYLLPVLGVGFARVWVGERPNLYTLGGGALTLLGIILVSRWGQPRR